ncbi:MAG: undecaprenyl-diphosphate phosphatase [Planctomycetota bacterium]
MTFLEALLLGGLQGLTEFLPVSSSGHDVLARHLLGVDLGAQAVAWEVLVHLASALAILVFFAWDVRNLPLMKAPAEGEEPVPAARFLWRWGLFLVLCTIPAGLAYIGLHDAIEHAFNSALLVGCALLVTGTVLFVIDRAKPTGTLRVHQVAPGSRGMWRLLAIGLAQACALVPGFSRSGFTISAGLAVGLERAEAVRFAFYLGFVAIAAAVVVKHKQLAALPETLGTGPMFAGFAASFVVSLGSLWLLLALVRGMKLRVCSFYCWAAGLTAIIATLVQRQA